MLLVSVVLLVVFGAVCFSSYHRLRRGCLDALHQAISRPMDDKPPRLELGEVKRPPQWQAEMAPVFVVELSGDGSVAFVRGQNIAVDTDGMETLVNTALAQGQNLGCCTAMGCVTWCRTAGTGRARGSPSRISAASALQW